MLTQPAATAASAWVHSASTRPDWRCRWCPSWPTSPRSSRHSPAPGSGVECSRTGWSVRPWGGPGRRGRHSFPPVRKKKETWGFLLKMTCLKLKQRRRVVCPKLHPTISILQWGTLIVRCSNLVRWAICPKLLTVVFDLLQVEVTTFFWMHFAHLSI